MAEKNPKPTSSVTDELSDEELDLISAGLGMDPGNDKSEDKDKDKGLGGLLP